MKNVFTNSHLCHVWANQSQASGRSGRMFFEGTKIYSYGRHYLAAEIYTVKGRKIALVNSNKYSNTTAKHLSEIRSSLHGLMNYYEVPNPSELKAKENIDYHVNRVTNKLQCMLKNIKVTSIDVSKYAIENLNDTLKESNAFLKLAGQKSIKIPAKKIEQIKKHYAARYKRYLELNTPEMIAKKEAIKARKLVLKKEKDAESLKSNIFLFRLGASVLNSSFKELKFDLLRVQGDEVVTTRGARVSLELAKKAIEQLNSVKLSKKRDTKIELEVGDFMLTNITPIVNEEFKDDFLLTVGCHRILLSEVRAVLS